MAHETSIIKSRYLERRLQEELSALKAHCCLHGSSTSPLTNPSAPPWAPCWALELQKDQSIKDTVVPALEEPAEEQCTEHVWSVIPGLCLVMATMAPRRICATLPTANRLIYCFPLGMSVSLSIHDTRTSRNLHCQFCPSYTFLLCMAATEDIGTHGVSDNEQSPGLDLLPRMIPCLWVTSPVFASLHFTVQIFWAVCPVHMRDMWWKNLNNRSEGVCQHLGIVLSTPEEANT